MLRRRYIAVAISTVSLARGGDAQAVDPARAGDAVEAQGTSVRAAPIRVFGFPPAAEALPCGQEAVFARGLAHFWYTRLPEARQAFDSVRYALDTCGAAGAPTHGLRVLLAHARVEQRAYRSADAIRYVLALLAEADPVREPAIVAEALLVKALAHEFTEQAPEMFDALARAGALVRAYDLVATRSTYYVRASSAQRLHGDPALALRLADSAIVAAQRNGRLRDETDGIFLRATLLSVDAPAERMVGFRRAAALFRAAGTLDGYAMMLTGVGAVHQRAGEHARALATLDSARALAARAREAGYETAQVDASIADRLAVSYRATGRHDSAYANLARARRGELAHAYDNRTSDVLRLDREAERLRATAALAAERDVAAAERTGRRRLAWAAAALAVLSAGLLAAVALLARARSRIRTEVARQSTLRDELQHRVKNNFQILISFLEAQAERSQDPVARTAFVAMSRRVHNLAHIHAQLYDEVGEHGAEVQQYLRRLVEAFRGLSPEPDALRVRVDGPAMQLPPRHLSALGIIVNELLTNSVKHAAGDGDSVVDVTLVTRVDAGAFVLTYADSGPGPAPGVTDATVEFRERGRMGAYLITAMVEQLEGAIAPADPNPGPGGGGGGGGFAIAIAVPLPAGADELARHYRPNAARHA